jgi:hypothetical protein
MAERSAPRNNGTRASEPRSEQLFRVNRWPTSFTVKRRHSPGRNASEAIYAFAFTDGDGKPLHTFASQKDSFHSSVVNGKLTEHPFREAGIV